MLLPVGLASCGSYEMAIEEGGDTSGRRGGKRNEARDFYDMQQRPDDLRCSSGGRGLRGLSGWNLWLDASGVMENGRISWQKMGWMLLVTMQLMMKRSNRDGYDARGL